MTFNHEKKELVFVPLGGLGEIGMNLALYGYGDSKKRSWLMVDIGISFPDETQPGVDFILPDISFIEKNLSDLKGIVITHAHEDHYGALRILGSRLRVPVWMTPFAAALYSTRYENFEGDSSSKISIIHYEKKETFTLGPFSIEAIPVTHSIPESMAIAITTPAGVVVHTGDWRIDSDPIIDWKTDEKRFKELGDAGVLALMCESTNSLKEGETVSEGVLEKSLENIIKDSPGRVIIGMFSSNVGRIFSIARLAKTYKKKILILGRSLLKVVDVARDFGYFPDIDDFIEIESFRSIPPQELIVICTGTQGEEFAAFAKLSREEMKNVFLAPGDCVIFSSRPIPGNEKAISLIKDRFINMGLDIIESSEALIHVSGHAYKNELLQMYQWTRPKIGVPIHGNALHLAKHAEFMKRSSIKNVMEIRNGDMLRLYPGKPTIIEKVHHGHLYKDGTFLGDDTTLCIQDRRKLAYAGHIMISINLSVDYTIKDLAITLTGVPHYNKKFSTKESENVFFGFSDMKSMIEDSIYKAFDSLSEKKRENIHTMRDFVVRAVKNQVYRCWRKKPLINIHIFDVKEEKAQEKKVQKKKKKKTL